MSAILPPNDERIRKFLRQAGVDENSPVDPVSRDALLELLHETAKEPAMTANASQRIAEAFTQYPTLPDPSETTTTTTMSSSSCPIPEHSEAATAVTLEDRILQRMQQQTQMILDLHKRMDYLTALVQQSQQQQQQQQQKPAETSREKLNRQIDELFQQVQLYEQNDEHPWTAPTPNTTPRPQSFVSQQRHRLSQVIQIFFALRRRLAPNFDGGLIVKVIFILSILISRLSRRQNSVNDDEWMWHFYRLHFLVLFVVGGFLYQTGMFKVIYIFYVQEKYFHRILWKGEDLGDMEQEVNGALERYVQRIRPRVPPRNQPPLPGQGQPPRPRDGDDGEGNENPEENGADPHPGWRDTFVGGVIQPAPHNEQDRGVQFLRDVGFFIGSFFLSIFPMWRPEALVAPPRPGPVEDDDDDAVDGNGLPEVAAPADVLQAAEDDEEDGNEEAKVE